MGRALLALVLMLSAAPGLAAREALAALDSCIQQLDPKVDVGYAKIATLCPDLAPSLEASPWGAWLPSDWSKPDNTLSGRGLVELRTLISRESRRAGAVQPPHLERLAAVLAALHQSPPEQRTWWARFKAWLRDVLTRPSAPSDNSWLRRLLARFSIPQGTLAGLRVGALVLLAVLTGAILFAELRAAGLLGRRRRAPGAALALRAGVRARTWADIEAAEPSEQPRLLLELVTARLAAQGQLPPARAFTVRELLGAARLPRSGDHERLAELARASERLRFSDGVLSPQLLRAALERGRELLAGLEPVSP